MKKSARSFYVKIKNSYQPISGQCSHFWYSQGVQKGNIDQKWVKQFELQFLRVYKTMAKKGSLPLRISSVHVTNSWMENFIFVQWNMKKRKKMSGYHLPPPLNIYGLIMCFRGVFRIQSNISDGAFLRK